MAEFTTRIVTADCDVGASAVICANHLPQPRNEFPEHIFFEDIVKKYLAEC